MVTQTYYPKRGDVVWMDFSPQLGHEQRGRRPALCVSADHYNQRVGLAIFCPITSQIKGYPFEVLLPIDFPVYGVILADQVKSLDWRLRNIEFIQQLPDSLVSMALGKLKALL